MAESAHSSALGPLVLAATSLFAASLAGCDLVNSATSRVVVAGVLATSPEIQLTSSNNTKLFDVPAQTIATCFVGERASATSTDEPTPVKGANVVVAASGQTVKLTELTGKPGFYEVDSSKASNLVYTDGGMYTFSASIPNDDTGEHGGVVTAPTRLSNASITLTPAPTPIAGAPAGNAVQRFQKNTALTVGWQAQNGRYAYVTVLRSDPQHPSAPESVFDSSPKTAGDIINFIAGTPPTSITIPASTFAQDGVYAVVLVTSNNGMPKTNTFLGSPLLAGSGAAVLLAVGNVML